MRSNATNGRLAEHGPAIGRPFRLTTNPVDQCAPEYIRRKADACLCRAVRTNIAFTRTRSAMLRVMMARFSIARESGFCAPMGEVSMAREDVSISTDDGECRTAVFTPDTGSGPWPAAIFFMDGLGIRPVLFQMAQRLADGGYVVLLPDLYYRAGPYEPLD